jgi:hypothetical protein
VSIIKLTNGGTIQVRTGVLAGVGPQGARGPVGPQGPIGDVGPQGVQGEMGQILEQMSQATITSSTALTAATEANVAFQTSAYDDLSCFASVTNIQLRDLTDYQFNIWVEFAAPSTAASGIRKLRLVSVANGTLCTVQVPPVVDDSTVLQIIWPYRNTALDDIVTVKATSTQACNVTTGKIAVNRIGSGPRGATGPQGPQGLQGVTGATGPQGPAGNANSGFTTYADLL